MGARECQTAEIVSERRYHFFNSALISIRANPRNSWPKLKLSGLNKGLGRSQHLFY